MWVMITWWIYSQQFVPCSAAKWLGVHSEFALLKKEIINMPDHFIYFMPTHKTSKKRNCPSTSTEPVINKIDKFNDPIFTQNPIRHWILYQCWVCLTETASRMFPKWVVSAFLTIPFPYLLVWTELIAFPPSIAIIVVYVLPKVSQCIDSNWQTGYRAVSLPKDIL